MCGRYELDLDNNDIISEKIKKRLKEIDLPLFKEKEVFPHDNCLLFIPKDNNKIDLDVKKWGINKNIYLINARKESIKNKYIYQDMLNNRCIVIASGFYEWHNKEKYYIQKEEKIIYLAGIYNRNNEFLIITGQAKNDLAKIHKRTPIIFNKEEMLNYLFFKQDIYINNDNLIINKI